MKSAIYKGWLRHRRRGPAANEFTYGVVLFYADLAELSRWPRLPFVFDVDRPALVAFRREDYLGDKAEPLDAAVRRCVREESGFSPSGPIRLLTQLRYFGYGFNPVSFYYCFDPSGERVEAVVAEITNTPWKERHRYVLRADGARRAQAFAFDKAFHVSPFMSLDQRYQWLFSPPGETLLVHMDNVERGAGQFFDATLHLSRRELTPPTVARALWEHPFMTGKTAAAIHYQALKLWIKGAKVHPHPAQEASRESHPHP